MDGDTGAAKGELCGVCRQPMIEAASTCQACGAERRLKGAYLYLFSIVVALMGIAMMAFGITGWDSLSSAGHPGGPVFLVPIVLGIVALLVAAFVWFKTPATVYYVEQHPPR